MKFYTIKPEYLSMWGDYTTAQTIITEADVTDLAKEWETTEGELLAQLEEFAYTEVGDAVLKQEGVPPTVYMSLEVIRKDEEPDEDGCVCLYELVWHNPDAEEVDWNDPDEVRPTGYGWCIEQARRI